MILYLVNEKTEKIIGIIQLVSESVFMVDIELTGILEEKLRRLVELGLYSSLSEAVRDAVRKLLKEIDLREISLKLYVNDKTSFQYAAYFAGLSFPEMSDYMVSRGIIPLVGVNNVDYLKRMTPDNIYIVDPLTIYLIYTYNIQQYFEKLAQDGYQFLAPISAETLLETIMYPRLYYSVNLRGIIKFIEKPKRVYISPKVKITLHEAIALAYAKSSKKIIYMTEDMRTRLIANEYGVDTCSLLSILLTLRNEIEDDKLRTIVFGLKSFPTIIHEDVLRVLEIGV